MTTKDKIAVMQACVDGARIEIKIEIKGATPEWVMLPDNHEPEWDWWRSTYRVAKKEITEGMTGVTVDGHQFEVWKKFDVRWRGVVNDGQGFVSISWADDGQSKVYSPYSIPL